MNGMGSAFFARPYHASMGATIALQPNCMCWGEGQYDLPLGNSPKGVEKKNVTSLNPHCAEFCPDKIIRHSVLSGSHRGLSTRSRGKLGRCSVDVQPQARGAQGRVGADRQGGPPCPPLPSLARGRLVERSCQAPVSAG